MTAMTVAATVLVALAVLLGCRPRRGDHRLAQVLHRPAGPPAVATRPRATPTTACLVAGGSLVLLLPAPAGPVLGVLVALAGPRVLAGLEPADARAERAQLTADLPLLLDLLAACLAGGASLPEAARVVAPAVPGPAGRRLAQVSALLAVGTPPGQAWAALTGPIGPTAAAGPDPLGPASRALGRAADGGAPVAAAVARLATEARAQARAEAEQGARRVGVLVVAPLGLCFLPAFVLLGVVPVVVGLAGPLLATF